MSGLENLLEQDVIVGWSLLPLWEMLHRGNVAGICAAVMALNCVECDGADVAELGASAFEVAWGSESFEYRLLCVLVSISLGISAPDQIQEGGVNALDFRVSEG